MVTSPYHRIPEVANRGIQAGNAGTKQAKSKAMERGSNMINSDKGGLNFCHGVNQILSEVIRVKRF
jgi:hypothetical protein